MLNIKLRFVFDRKNEATLTKQGLLQIEAKLVGRPDRVFLTTGIKLYKNQFSDKMGFTCKNHNQADAITRKAKLIFDSIEKYSLSENLTDIKDMKSWNLDKSSVDSVIKFMQQEMRLRNMEYNTMKAHVSLVNKLVSFDKIKTFQHVTLPNIIDFDAQMRESKISNVSINKMHVLFKMYLKLAISKGLLAGNPYDRFTPPKAKNTDPVFLTQDEVLKIKGLDGLNEKLSKVRDLFLFQCFTGMAYADMQLFNHECVHLEDGKEIIRSSRVKTDESFVMLFLPEAKEVAEKYNYQLPKISNQKYNDYLKLLVAHPDVNINKKVTSHTARHTFATYLINKGIPLESVSKILGHSNIKQSQHYARLLGKKVISDMEKYLKK